MSHPMTLDVVFIHDGAEWSLRDCGDEDGCLVIEKRRTPIEIEELLKDPAVRLGGDDEITLAEPLCSLHIPFGALSRIAHIINHQQMTKAQKKAMERISAVTQRAAKKAMARCRLDRWHRIRRRKWMVLRVWEDVIDSIAV